MFGLSSWFSRSVIVGAVACGALLLMVVGNAQSQKPRQDALLRTDRRPATTGRFTAAAVRISNIQR